MAALTGKKPKNTYKDLLQVSNSNAGIDGTLRFVSDGEGTDSTLKLSTASISTTSKIVVGGDTAASDAAAIGYTSAEGLIITGQGSTSDITVKNDADAAVLTVATGTTNVDIVGDVTASTVNADGDTSASDNAAMGYTSAEGLILTGQGSTNDITIKNDADADVITVATGGTNVDIVGDVTAATVNADGDTSAGDDAAMGYTSAEGLILTGQGSTNDITIKNDADSAVISVPTGTTNVTIAGDLTISGDDLTMGTNTSGAALIADGTNFNPVVISGDVSIGTDGTAAIGSGVIVNADVNGSAAIDVSKTALSAGTGISLSTNTLNVDAAQTGITSLLATDIKIGEDDETKVDFETADEIHFYAANVEQVYLADNIFGPQSDSDVDLGTTGVRWKDAYIDSITTTGTITSGGTVAVTGNVTATGTIEPAGDTSASDNAAIGYTSAEGLILTGQGSTSDVTVKNDADGTVFSIPTGTDDILFPDDAKAMWGDGSDMTVHWDGTDGHLTVGGTLNIDGSGETMATFVDDGAVTLYHNNVAKVATSANGVSVTGTLLATTDTDTSNTGSVTLDFSANQNFVLTFTGNVTLANPTTEQVGQAGVIVCIQDGTGSRTLSLGSQYKTAGDAGITLSTAANAVDIIPYFVSAADSILIGAVQLALSGA
jgi:hypothetical protein